MIGSFITGSQTEAHKLRMLKEAVKFMLRLTLISIICSCLYFFYKTPSYDLKVYYYYQKADTLKTLLKPTDLMEVTNREGKSLKLPIKSVLANNGVIQIKEEIERNLLKAVRNGLLLPFLIPFWFWFKGRGYSLKKTLRGGERVNYKFLKKQVRKYNDKFLKRNLWAILKVLEKIRNRFLLNPPVKKEIPPYFIANDIEYPFSAEHQHTFVTGASGTGKTVLLSALIDQIRKRGETAIIYDKMGSFIPSFYNETNDIILNPFDIRSKPWSIFIEIRKGKEEIDLRTMAEAIIPDEGNDKFWSKQARNLFIEIGKVLIKSKKASNKDLYQTVLKKSFNELQELLKESDVKDLFEDEEAKRTALSVKNTLTAYTQFLKILKDKKDTKESFSIRDFITESLSLEKEEGKGKILFLSSRSDMHSTLQPLLTCWIDIVINALLSGSQQSSKKIWIILDELPSINRIPYLEAGLSQSRQFGGCFVLTVQSKSQLQSVYGNTGTNTLSANCGTRAIFGSPDVESAKWMASSLGAKEMEETKEGITFGANEIRDGVSLNKHIKTEELVTYSEIMNQKNLNFYLKLSGGFPIAQIKIKPITRERIAESFIEDEKVFLEEEEKDSSAEGKELYTIEKIEKQKLEKKMPLEKRRRKVI